MQISRRSLLGVGVVACCDWRISRRAWRRPHSAPALAGGRPAHDGARHRQARRAGTGDRVVLPDLPALRRIRASKRFPQVKSQLIDTGKLHLVFRDFPLDQVALTAAMVARALPPERYEPFIAALFAPRTAGRSRAASTPPRSCQDGGAGRHVARPVRRGDRRHRAAQRDPAAPGRRQQKPITSNSTPTFIFNGPVAEEPQRPANAATTSSPSWSPRPPDNRMGVSRRLARQLHPPAHRRLQELRRAGGGGDPARPDRHRRAERLRQVQRGGGAALGDGRELRPQPARRRDGRRDLRRHRGPARRATSPR